MRGHACKGQLPAIVETRRSPAIMPNRDHCCVPQCQNNRAKIFQISPFINFRVINPFDSSGLSKFGETCNTYYDLVHLQITNSTRVCSVHFKEADFNTTLTGKRFLEKYAVPSIFCWSRYRRAIYLFNLFIHRPLPLLQVNTLVRISLNIPWLKSWNNQKYFYVLILIQSINFRPSFQWCSMEVQPELSSSQSCCCRLPRVHIHTYLELPLLHFLWLACQDNSSSENWGVGASTA